MTEPQTCGRIGYRTVLIRRREVDAFLKANERRVA